MKKTLSPEERIQRVKEMEAILDAHSARLSAMEAAIQALHEGMKDYETLKNYYIQGGYMEDVESDNRGELPEDLSRGVLSEDAVFDLFGEHMNTAIEMLETATEMIKKY